MLLLTRLCCVLSLVIASTASAVTMEWVPVGNPGNPGDPQESCSFCGSGTTFGSVPYTYLISKNEVTNAQYAEFLNAVASTDTNGLYYEYSTSYGGGITRIGFSGSYSYAPITGRENMPVNNVSFLDALRFANWLQNGQPTGAQTAATTE